MARALWLLLGVSIWGACASLPDPCDPGFVTAKLQAMAIECRAARQRECLGVSQETFERDPLTCPAALKCYHAMDQEALDCVGR